MHAPLTPPSHGGVITSTPHRPGASILLLQPIVAKEPAREFLLSIGRIFHKISLVDSEITVTRFRPRHPYPPINIDYRYRFKAPQHETYEVSGVHFTTEKLENFNWNYMDQYICTRGDTDYHLVEVLLSMLLPCQLSLKHVPLPSHFAESQVLAFPHVPTAQRASGHQAHH